jgi:Ring finger domain
MEDFWASATGSNNLALSMVPIRVLQQLQQYGNNSNATADSAPIQFSSNLTKATNIVLLVAVGLAMLLSLMGITFLFSLLADLYAQRTGFLSQQQLLQGDQHNNHGQQPSIAQQAKLHGLTLNERKAILEELFKTATYVYHSDELDGDIELGDVSLRKDGSQNPGTTNDVADKAVALVDENELQSEEIAPEYKEGLPLSDDQNANGAVKDLGEEDEMGERPDRRHRSTSQEFVVQGDFDEDVDTDRQCCICLSAYEPGDVLLAGLQCSHRFHTGCCQQWLLKHDHCPYCRSEMMTADTLRNVARAVLGLDRVEELTRSNTATTDLLPAENVAVAPQEHLNAIQTPLGENRAPVIVSEEPIIATVSDEASVGLGVSEPNIVEEDVESTTIINMDQENKN